MQLSADAFERDVHCLLGLPFDAIDMAGAVQRVRNAAQTRLPCFISTPNLNFMVGCRDDAGFRDSVIHSDLSVADGMPVVWIARLLGIPIRERIAGASLFESLARSPGRPLKVYFFGGADGVAEAAARRLNASARGLQCVGCESPGFGSVEALSRDESIARINASGADFLVVSLGAKKGQAWIEKNRSRLAVPAVSHLGAVINFAAGTVRRAPRWMQDAGLEWLWRIREELPLLGRYWSDGLAFLRLLATHVVPLAWLLRAHRPSAIEIDQAALLLHASGRGTRIALKGAWTRDNLEPLRTAFTLAATAEQPLLVDLAGVTYLDASALGLLLLLYGTRPRQDRRLVCRGASRRVRRIFEYAGAGFLLDGGPAHPGRIAPLDQSDGEEPAEATA